jgi:hypothetical protein
LLSRQPGCHTIVTLPSGSSLTLSHKPIHEYANSKYPSLSTSAHKREALMQTYNQILLPCFCPVPPPFILILPVLYSSSPLPLKVMNTLVSGDFPYCTLHSISCNPRSDPCRDPCSPTCIALRLDGKFHRTFYCTLQDDDFGISTSFHLDFIQSRYRLCGQCHLHLPQLRKWLF